MKYSPLRILLALDAAVLFLLGLFLILAPKQVELAFHFKDLPNGVSYIIGLWGCILATMALGYGVASTDPIRHLVWVQVGIARGGKFVTGIACRDAGAAPGGGSSFQDPGRVERKGMGPARGRDGRIECVRGVAWNDFVVAVLRPVASGVVVCPLDVRPRRWRG